MTTLAANHLSVAVGQVQVCHDFTQVFAPGQCWAILGRNGSGKTTLLRTLAGLRAPQRGQVILDDKPIEHLPRRQRAQRLGLLPQDSHDDFPATVLETALLGRHPHLSPWGWEGETDYAIARRSLRQVGLEGWDARDITTLSGGERRRVALATLFAQDTDILLLDEPTNHLDLQHQVTLLEGLTRRAREYNRTVIMVLHDPNLAARYADHCLLLYGDGTLCAGPCADVLETTVLEKLYGQRLRQVSERPGGWLPQ